MQGRRPAPGGHHWDLRGLPGPEHVQKYSKAGNATHTSESRLAAAFLWDFHAPWEGPMAPRRRSGGPMMLMLGGGPGGLTGRGTEPMMLVMPLSEEACDFFPARAACLVHAKRAPRARACARRLNGLAGARARRARACMPLPPWGVARPCTQPLRIYRPCGTGRPLKAETRVWV